MQNKYKKCSFKICLLCDQLCYKLKSEVYTGKFSNNLAETGLGAKGDLNLMNGLLEKNPVVFMDYNYLIVIIYPTF